jgi:hypothetical protein
MGYASAACCSSSICGAVRTTMVFDGIGVNDVPGLNTRLDPPRVNLLRQKTRFSKRDSRQQYSLNIPKGEQKEGMSFYRSCPPGLLNFLIPIEFPVEFASSRIRVRSQIV